MRGWETAPSPRTPSLCGRPPSPAPAGNEPRRGPRGGAWARPRLGTAPARHGPAGPSCLSPGSPAVLHTHAQRGGRRRWTWRGRTALLLTTGDNATASVNDGRRAARGSAHALFTQVTLTVPCAFAVTVSVTSIKHGCAIHPTVHTPSHQNQAQHTPVTVTLKPQRPHPSRPPSCRTAARMALDQPRVSTPCSKLPASCDDVELFAPPHVQGSRGQAAWAAPSPEAAACRRARARGGARQPGTRAITGQSVRLGRAGF